MTAKFTGPSRCSLARGPAGGISGGPDGSDGCCEAEMDRKWPREVQMQNEFSFRVLLKLCADKSKSKEVEE